MFEAGKFFLSFAQLGLPDLKHRFLSPACHRHLEKMVAGVRTFIFIWSFKGYHLKQHWALSEIANCDLHYAVLQRLGRDRLLKSLILSGVPMHWISPLEMSFSLSTMDHVLDWKAKILVWMECQLLHWSEGEASAHLSVPTMQKYCFEQCLVHCLAVLCWDFCNNERLETKATI